MSHSMPSLANNNVGKRLLRGMAPALAGRRTSFESDWLGGFISTKAGRIDLDVLAAVFDKVIEEIQQLPGLLLTRDPEHQFHITAVLVLRGGPKDADMAFLEQLTTLVMLHLEEKSK